MAATGADSLPILPVVSVALIDGRGQVLLQQRPPGKAMAGLWEFPGGKINPGETPEEALCRELQEELGITVAPGDLSEFGFASHRYETFHILLLLWTCKRWQGTPASRENQVLAWTIPAQMSDYPMPAADAPLVTLLQARL
jgi:8-oxo-dGTP diphosphatase